MKILVYNAGSSSLKFGVFDMNREDSRVLKGEFEGFHNGTCTLHYRLGGEQGETFKRVEACTPLAPLHNPAANLKALMTSRALWPDLPKLPCLIDRQ